MEEERQREREIEIGRGGNVMTLLKIVLLTNWWVSAAFWDSSLQVHLSACLSVSCFIVVLLSMPDLQLYPDSPNDNAAGKREVVDGRGVNKRSTNHRSTPLSPPPLSAGLDSPGEIKPVCNPALPLHVCVFTTWPQLCCTRSHSSVCGPRPSLLNQMEQGGKEMGCIHCPWLTASQRDRCTVLVFLPCTDNWWAINLQPLLPPSSHGHNRRFQAGLCMNSEVSAVWLSSDGLF